MNYTKGEWTVYKDTLTQHASYLEIKHKPNEKVNKEIAYVYHEDDAQLISAAPDMYIAGQGLDYAIGSAIIEIAKNTKLDNKIAEIIQQYIVPAQENWRKALAKAEGKT